MIEIVSYQDLMQLPSDERKIEPGWAIKSRGQWVDSSWEISLGLDPFDADIFDTKEKAENYIKVLEKDGLQELEIVLAWEPYCAKLLMEIYKLEKANIISPSNFSEIIFNLENVLDTLKGK